MFPVVKHYCCERMFCTGPTLKVQSLLSVGHNFWRFCLWIIWTMNWNVNKD